METKENIGRPAGCNFESMEQDNNPDLQPSADDSQSHLGIKEDVSNVGTLSLNGSNIGVEADADNSTPGLSDHGTEGGSGYLTFSDGNIEDQDVLVNKTDSDPVDGETEVDMDLVDSPMHVNIQVTEVLTVQENMLSTLNAENGSLDAPPESFKARTGVKRTRTTYEQQQPSVRVMYSSLARASKRKLEELLQQWSEWHTTNSMYLDPDESLESGEETYFPAIRTGMAKSCKVSFCIDDRTRDEQNNGPMPLDSNSVPLYDRGFLLGLTSADGPLNAERGLEIVGDPARCFNCGSYNHALKDCNKPRDNLAVSNARRQHMAKRNQNSHSRSSIRYYQSSSSGKYDGLKPGTLDAETRTLLGLRELDPPPWLNRMRELGYPPGYLDSDEEDQPSGITIFGEEEVISDLIKKEVISEEQEEGEINDVEEKTVEEEGAIKEMNVVKPGKKKTVIEEGEMNEMKAKKKTVEFPGINAPIPENADEWLWGQASSSSDTYRNRSQREHSSRFYQSEQRRTRSFMDDGPPGVDPVISPSMSSYPPRYGSHGGYDSPRDLAPAFARDREWRSPPRYDDYGSRSSYRSPREYSSSRYEYDMDDRWDGRGADYEFEGHHHSRRRMS
ncbi:Zinc finger CCHC domain-containing protein 8 [Linum grandiflorum]